jgi:nucleoside-diphosphate-sugar epimerase
VSVAVTGGAGFIGSHLVDALVSRGARVTVLDDFSTGFESNLAAVQSEVRLVRGDIRSAEACRDAFAGAAFVFHEAALGSVPRSMRDPAMTIDVNVRGTATVFAACREMNVGRVVYASSSSVYGDSATLPKKEGEEGRPLSPYALSKVMGEQLADVFGRCFSMEFIGLRYFNVFGPRQSPEGPYAAVVPRFFAAVRAGRSPVVYGDGSQSRDFTYVGDVVEANLLAAGAGVGACGYSMNVAPGGGTTVRELAAEIIGLHGSHLSVEFAPPRPGDILHSLADSTRSENLLGFQPHWTLRDGLQLLMQPEG